MVVANSGVPHGGGGVLQQQSPPVGAVVGAPGVAKSPYSQTAATAARVAAALAKSAQSVGQVQQQPRAQFYGHNPNLKCEYSITVKPLCMQLLVKNCEILGDKFCKISPILVNI